MNALFVVVAAVVVLVLSLFYAYNLLVRSRQKVSEALSGIDVQLRLRHDLVPPLVRTVAEYARHEASLLERAARLRSEAELSQSAALGTMVENQLAATLTAMTALAEANPNLAASANFIELGDQLIEIEDEIQAASAIYNTNVRSYNSLIQSIPAAFIARPLGFRAANFVQLDIAEVRGRDQVAA